MASPFGTTTKVKLLEYLTGRRIKELGANRSYYQGDHWQKNAGWAGPLPTGDDGGKVELEIKRAFVSLNMVRQVCDRHAAGVVGSEPSWGLTVRRALKPKQKPTLKEQKLIDEAEALLTVWWDERGIHELLQKVVATANWAERAALRLFVPPGELVTNPTTGKRVAPQMTLEQALMQIWLDTPDPEQATVYTDRRTMQKVGIYTYQDEEKVAWVEATYLDDAAPTDMQSAQGAPAQRKVTVVQVTKEDKSTGRHVEPQNNLRLPLGGHLMMYELELPLLVTPQVCQQQRLLNLALTLLSRNVVAGGFLERIFLDAQMPGYFKEDPENEGKWIFVPQPYKTGPMTTNYVSGTVATNPQTKEPILDAEGRPTVSRPDVRWRDPVKIDTFTGTAAEAKRGILEECHQVHTLTNSESNLSGESRLQARADYMSDLLIASGRVNIMGRWLIETVLSLAAYLAGDPAKFDSLRATFACRINPGPLSADETRLIIERVDKKLLSQENGMALTGVQDTDAEKALIAEETDAALKRQQQVATPPAPAAKPGKPAIEPKDKEDTNA